MNEQKPQEGIKVPAKAQHQIKMIVAKDKSEFEKETNEFLTTISDEKRLVSLVFSTNAKTGELVHIINYSVITPMTREEWEEKQEKQKKFAAGFIPESLMPNEPKVSKL